MSLSPVYTPAVTSNANIGDANAGPVTILNQTRAGEQSRNLQGTVVITGLSGTGSLLTITRSLGGVAQRPVEIEVQIGVTSIEVPLAPFVARDTLTLAMTLASDNAADSAVGSTVTLWSVVDINEIAAATVEVTAEDISPKRTWCFPKSGSPVTATNYVPVAASQAGPVTVCFDLEGVIESNVVVAGITSTTISDSGATIGDVVKHTSQRKVNVPLSAITATPGRYTVTLTFIATDSEQYVVRGVLEVQ